MMIYTRRKALLYSAATLLSLSVKNAVSSNSYSDIVSGLLEQNNKHSYKFYPFDYVLKPSISSGVTVWDFGKRMSNFQYHAFDEINGFMYTLQHSSSNSNGGKITRFPLRFSEKPHPIDEQEFSTSIGHQMLSIENTNDGNVKIWSAKGLFSSYSVIRFDYCPHGQPQNIQEFVVFNPEEFGEFYPTGNLSYDQKWLIVRGKSKKESKYNGFNCVAVFNIEKLLKYEGSDVWHLADFIWPYDFYENDPETNNNPQSIVSDGNSIYLIFGPREINKENIIRKYSFSGKLLEPATIINVGVAQAQRLSEGTSNEIEGAQFLKIKKNQAPFLTLGYVRGGPVYYKGISLITP